LLPAAAVVIPVLVSLAHATTATTVQANPYEPWSLLIYDVFTESVPIMLAGLAIGLVAPAAGLLFVLVYGIGNVAATIVTGELEPVLPALYGRLASLVILWLLVVDIPLVGRRGVEWWIGRGPASRSRRAAAVIAGSLVASSLIVAWSLAAGMLIGVVFLLTGRFGTGPTLRASNTLEVSPWLLFGPATILVVVVLALRYLGKVVPLALDEPRDPPPSRARRYLLRVSNLAMVLILLSGMLHKVIDLVILAAALVLGRPLARAILRSTGLARPLARVPWQLRLVAGGAAAMAFSVAFIRVIGNSDVSRWFNAVIAVAISFVLIEVFLEADRVARETKDRPDGGSTSEKPAVTAAVLGLVAVLELGAFVLPGTTFADAYGDLADTFWLIAGLAAGSAAFLAALADRAVFGPGPEERHRGEPDPGLPPPPPPYFPTPKGWPRDPITGEPWDGLGPYPRNPNTGEPIQPGPS
jgi:hypothetical protein